jgi:multidrug efflux pump subunit AcrA (membrane-fusion protein)
MTQSARAAPQLGHPRGFVTGIAACAGRRPYAPRRMGPACTQFTHSFRGPRQAALCAALLLASLLGSVPASAQEVYKSVDADGHVVYSDRGSSKTAPKTDLHVQEGDAANAARLAKEQQLLDADEQQRRARQSGEDKSKAQQEAKARQQQQRCENAKNRYYAMKEANRLYTRDADGNRVYYSDEDADKKRDEAKRAMDAACGN